MSDLPETATTTTPTIPSVEVGAVQGTGRVAKPMPCMPDSPEAVINNVLCRELVSPTPGTPEYAPDPGVHVLEEITKGLAHGTEFNHVVGDAQRIASHPTEKINLVKSILLGINLNRVSTFVKMRDQAESALSKCAARGDLNSTEYLSFLRYSSTELKSILENINEEADKSGVSTVDMFNVLDVGRQADEAAAARQFDGTSPLARQLIRQQFHVFEKTLKGGGKLTNKKPIQRIKKAKSKS